MNASGGGGVCRNGDRIPAAALSPSTMKSWVCKWPEPLFIFFGFYINGLCGRCLRRSRLSVAHPGAAQRSEWRRTSGAEEGAGAFVGELRGIALLVRFTSTSGQGWLIRRLFEVWMLFTLGSLLGSLHPLSYPCTVQTS